MHAAHPQSFAPSRQRGAASLLGLAITLMIGAALLFNVIIPLAQDYELRQEARRTGNFLAQYHTAVRHLYAYYGIGSVPTGNRTGTDWLKSLNDCFGGSYTGSYSPPEAGNPPQGFLPCAFPNQIGLGQVPNTNLSVSGGIFTATTRIGPFTSDDNGQPDIRLAALIQKAAEAQSWDEGTRASGMFFGYSTSTDPAASDFGQVIGTATTNYAVSEIYLPRDGNLPMLGDLDMGANSINNALDIAGTGTLAMDVDVIAGRDVLGGNDVAARQDVVSLSGNVIANTGDLVSVNGDVVAANGALLVGQNIVSTNGDMIAQDGYLRTVQIDGRAARLSQALFDKRVVPSQSTVTAPQCPGGARALIFAQPEAYVSGNPAYTIYGVNRRVTDLGGGNWRVEVLLLVNNGGTSQWVSVPPQYGVINVSFKCP